VSYHSEIYLSVRLSIKGVTQIKAAASSASFLRSFPVVPQDPLVKTKKLTSYPSAFILAIVPKHPNSISSGCGPIASTFVISIL
jgi:hypothetical protein